MHAAFIAQCTSIANLMVDGDGLDDAVRVPGVNDHVVEYIADDVLKAAESLDTFIQTYDTAYLLDALKMADFLGHEPLIRASAKELASRLEGLSRDEMAMALGLSDDECVSTPMMENDAIWIDKALT